MKVTSPKTARSGKGERIVPLFPELRAELDASFALDQPGTKIGLTSPVIGRYRGTEANLRTQLHRIADTAGVVKWPKPFIALRASRRTEMQAAGVKGYVLDAWFGHSAAVAAKHYLMVTEEDYAAATDPDSVDPLVAPSQGELGPPQEIRKRKNPGNSGVLMPADGVGWEGEYTRQDSNLQPSVPKTDALSNCATGASQPFYARAKPF